MNFSKQQKVQTVSKKTLRSVGIDLGTSTIKISSNNGQSLVKIPSIMSIAQIWVFENLSF